MIVDLSYHTNACMQGRQDFYHEFGRSTELTYELWKWAERKDYLWWGISHMLDDDTAQACLMYLRDRGHVVHIMNPVDCLVDIVDRKQLTKKHILMLIDIINDEN